MAAENLPTLDWNAWAVLIGTGIGTAVAVFWGYRSKKAEPAPTKDIILPSAQIVDMSWGPHLLSEMKQVSICLGDWREEMREWREKEIEHRHAREKEEAYWRGRQRAEKG